MFGKVKKGKTIPKQDVKMDSKENVVEEEILEVKMKEVVLPELDLHDEEQTKKVNKWLIGSIASGLVIVVGMGYYLGFADNDNLNAVATTEEVVKPEGNGSGVGQKDITGLNANNTELEEIESSVTGGVIVSETDVLDESYITYNDNFLRLSFGYPSDFYLKELTHESIKTIQDATVDTESGLFSLRHKKLDGIVRVFDLTSSKNSDLTISMQINGTNDVYSGEEKAVKTPTKFSFALPTGFTDYVPEKDAKEDAEKPTETKDSTETPAENQATVVATNTDPKFVASFVDGATKTIGEYKFLVTVADLDFYGEKQRGYQLSTKVGENTVYFYVTGVENDSIYSVLEVMESIAETLVIS